METILEETVATEDLKKFEQKYHVELNNGKVHQPVFVLNFIIAHMGSTKVLAVFLGVYHIDDCFTGIVRVSV